MKHGNMGFWGHRCQRRRNFSTLLALDIMGFFQPEGGFQLQDFCQGGIDCRVSDGHPTGASLLSSETLK